MDTIILVNRIKCNLCGDVIESEFRHDFKQCICGAVAVDGGKDYLRRAFTYGPDDYEDLSEVTTIFGDPVGVINDRA